MNEAPTDKPAGIVKTYGKQFVAALIVAVAGALVAAFQPLAGFVGDLFATEKLEIGQTVILTENQDTPIQVVLKTPSDTAKVSGGVVTLTPLDSSVQIIGPRTFAYPKGEGAVTLPGDAGLLKVRARTVGTERIRVDVVTNRDRRFSGVITLKSSASEPSVTENDLSGVWRVRLDDAYGQMTIKQRSRTDLHLTGALNLENGETLTVDNGFRDGVVFQIAASNPQGLKYQIEGVWCLIDRSGSKWMVVNAKSQGFQNGAAVRPRPRAPGLEEKCPDAAAMLTEAPGTGSFHASAPVG